MNDRPCRGSVASWRGRHASSAPVGVRLPRRRGARATIVQGVSQDVQVATDPAGAACELRDKDGKVLDEVALTPGYVRVRKGLQSYVVACRKEGFLDATSTLESGIEGDQAAGMTWGALSGLQGTAGSTVTSAALGTVMPAATASTL